MGRLIVIDGLDGSGKKTQAEKVYKYLKEKGYNAYKIEFPAYDSKSSGPVQMYLNGEIGEDPMSLSPKMCSTFYAVDRAIQYIKNFKAMLDQEDSIVITDRYISANIIHQGGKIDSLDERKEFFKWAYDFENNTMGVPVEDVTIFLEVPVLTSQKLMTKRYEGDESKKDIHECNTKYLRMCYDSSKSAIPILNNLGYNWKRINCVTEGNEMRDREEIFLEILNVVKDLL